MPVWTRNNLLMTFALPVIVLFSVYWFSRKKKIKTDSVSETSEQTDSSIEDYDLKLNHSGELSSDAADTLSDASSFASPQSSEKSIRTKSVQLMSSPKDNIVGNSISNSVPVTLSNCLKVDSHKMDSCVESNILYKTNDIQFSDVLNNAVESVNSDFNIESKNKNSLYNDAVNEESVPLNVECNEHEIAGNEKIVENSELKSFNSHPDAAELIRLLELNFHQNNKCKIERDSLRSNESNESAISSQGGDIEKLQTAETESNDSHSSVLDENSLSYVSDDSEYRLLVELKNKDSLSSVLDENSALSSFCEDSEKSMNAESPVAAIKSYADVSNNFSVPVDSADIDLTLKDPIDQCADPLESAAKTKVDDSVESQCSNSVDVDCCVQNLEKCLPEIKDSTDSNPRNSLVGATAEFPELESSDSNQRHQTTLTSSNEALESCDSCTSKSNLNPLSNEKPSSSTLDSFSIESLDQPSLENPCGTLPDNSGESNHVSAIDENHLQTPAAIDENDLQAPAAIDENDLQAPAAIDENHLQAPAAINENHLQAPEAIDENHLQAPEAIDENHLQAPEAIDENHLQAPEAIDENHLQAPAAIDENHFQAPAPIDENHFQAPAAIDENPEINPQIPVMDIQGHLDDQAAEGLNPEAWQIQDVQNDMLNGHQDEVVNAIEGNHEEHPGSQMVYEFELPQELCGRLIGKHGKHVKSIKDRSHTNVYIKRHPFNQDLKLVVIEGNRADVKEALDIIRRKYPSSRYPTVTLVRTNTPNVISDSMLQLHLPDGASCDVILSSLVSAGHFFLQQPTHPTYPSLSTLDQCMINCYSQLDTPLLPHPVEPGVICAAPVLRGWYRAQVVHVYENEVECELKFVDYGGFSSVPISSLRQIRSDFMSLPFQASECYLANVRPVDADVWSPEATATFEELAQGQILQALLVEYSPDGIPMVHLYRVQGITNMFINKELVERGLAVWVDHNQWVDPH